ncbi:MAG: preprotein translocase subunit SecA [Oscillospiraceae bacterium]|nr:preprotein translocase subunit SecA [Oscillospiraceae bacterium]
MSILNVLFGNYSKRELKRIQPIVNKVLALEDSYKALSDSELQAMTPKLKDRLAKGETLDDILPEAFATCREASARVLGMRHFPVQIIGGIVLHQGRIAEMRTGEGKTLVATLPAYLNALSGKGVHVVTVNDYLAKRDSDWMGKIFRFLGLTVGLISHDMENQARKRAYLCDITYATNNELGFDYLRDNMVIYKEQKVQRGHNYCIVDEVDSILIDEARTPLIISGPGEKSTELYQVADRFAKTLTFTKVAELDSKEDNDELYQDVDYLVDEKAKSATLTPSGIKKAEKYFQIENLNDPEHLTIQHHINQAIKANGVMQNEVDYVVKNGEVIIVDEFTGRLMYGRRYNDGLHQAIEAKEGVEVARESKTLATITFQNFFRLYNKLSGMTGTAMTEEAEFREIYKLDVVEIPTNLPVQRKDYPDVVYKTENAKFNAVIDDIVEHNKKGQPVLVGTINIEKSEHLSKMLRKRGIKHEVLNAKYHEKEAEIVAQAGHKGAVTIATNMAGRGTDIKLGGNSEFLAVKELRRKGIDPEIIQEATGFQQTEDSQVLKVRAEYKKLMERFEEETKVEAEEVRQAGGLCIIGTERHESRRIDNQLRGRAGRQGDPGESRFYISLEDDLMRLFGGDKIVTLMDRLKVSEDTPIENNMLSNTIESAQKKVESRNFGIRKNVLQYDDVNNRQREIIYKQRDQLLMGDDLKAEAVKMMEQSISDNVALYTSDEHHHDEHHHEQWNLNSLRDTYLGWLLTEDDLRYSDEELSKLQPEDIKDFIWGKAQALYQEREEKYGSDVMRELERVVMLKCVDTQWMEHIDNMEQLQRGIRLRAYAQKDPVVEYRLEGFDMFDQMVSNIRNDFTRLILSAQIKQVETKEQFQQELKKEANEEAERLDMKKPFGKKHGKPTHRHKEPDLPLPDKMKITLEEDDSQEIAEKAAEAHPKKQGRNELCACGSGKKYKNCCGRNQ